MEKTSSLQGALSLVATPIGNLEDITLRALRTLKAADLIYAEDTRRARKLLDRYNIRKRLESYHAFNERGRTPELISRVLAGERVAVVTDAGTPCIADPGFLLVREALKAGIEPEIIPGVSSLTFAVASSGLPSDRFAFYGFLPVKSGRRSARLAELAAEDKSAVVFESPHRMEKLLRELCETLGPDAHVAVVREATKLHQETLRGTAAELVERTAGRSWKGECVVVVSKQQGRGDSEDGFEDVSGQESNG